MSATNSLMDEGIDVLLFFLPPCNYLNMNAVRTALNATQ